MTIEAEMNHAVRQQYTTGDFATEDESKADFDRRVEESGCFRSYPEVWGYYTQPRIDALITQADKRPRIDRILVPTKKLYDAGWVHGIIGVECKESGKKIGPVIAQAMDYCRAMFILQPHNLRIGISWVFVWPCDTIYCSTASLMAQHCIGEAHPDTYNILKFASCGVSLMYVERDGRLTVNQKFNRGGRVGSR